MQGAWCRAQSSYLDGRLDVDRKRRRWGESLGMEESSSMFEEIVDDEQGCGERKEKRKWRENCKGQEYVGSRL